MTRNFFLGTLLMAFTLFGGKAAAAPEDTFWQWFKKNESRLFSFEANREAIFDELSEQMRRVNRDLVFEFSPVRPTGKREFVISADGNKAAFPAVQANAWLLFNSGKAKTSPDTVGIPAP